MTVAGGFGSAKGQVDFGTDGRCVYVRYAGVEVAHGAEGLVDVARVDRRRQAVNHVIGDGDCIFDALTGNGRDHRTKDFFLSDSHLAIDIGKDRGLEKPAVASLFVPEALASTQQFGVVIPADGDVSFR